MEDAILQYTYPRLDAEVSKHRNHLLKAPFCIHPSTGRVCVPVDPSRVAAFDPENVPTVGSLLRELNALGASVANGAVEGPVVGEVTDGGHHSGFVIFLSHCLGPTLNLVPLDWEQTSLKPYVDMLDRHVLGLMNEVRRIKREAGEFASYLSSSILQRMDDS